MALHDLTLLGYRAKRLVVLVSGRGSNLQSLLDAQTDQAGLLTSTEPGAFRCVAVISNRPGVQALQRASDHGVPVDVLDHRGFSSREQFDEALAERIASYSPDGVVLAGFMRVLGTVFVERFADRMINIHPSLLPAFQGLHTHERALAAGVVVHGATVHTVTSVLDEGVILGQAVVPVLPSDEPHTLAARVLAQEHLLLPAVVQAWSAQGCRPFAPAIRLMDPALVA